MNIDLFPILLAMLGLSFLVFIHELGHYIAARRAKMRVEVFSIGFGKPIYTWTYQGTKWQICYFLFGGYVKIAGMEKENGVDVHEIQDGFYAKSPWKRIQVALAGPVVNIVFAFLVFSAIWFMGGREKWFSEFTHTIGWVDPASELAKQGVKPGDTITYYDGKPFTGFKDLIYAGALKKEAIRIQGESIDYLSLKKTPYDYTVKGVSPVEGGIKSIGIFPASYVIFEGFDQELYKYSPAKDSGILPGDRVVFANGEFIFSAGELSRIVNRGDAFLTVKRGDKILHLRVPRVILNDLQLTAQQKSEFLDWKRGLGIASIQEKLFFVPYEIDVLGVVQRPFGYIDSDLVPESKEYNVKGLDEPLLFGDTIIAVNGTQVVSGMEIFQQLQKSQVLLAVSRGDNVGLVSDEEAIREFKDEVNWKDVHELTKGIGVLPDVKTKGNIVLLNPIVPQTVQEFKASEEGKKGVYASQFMRGILQESPSETRYLFLGATIHDRIVIYNPSPVGVFKDVVRETGRTISALATGSLSPKWLSGPVGIVRVMHYGLTVGIEEALYWLGLISLNLGLMNLLPLPVLDGGHICFSLWEWITRRRISPKVMEKIIFPFVVLLIVFFLYVTYQDISRFF